MLRRVRLQNYMNIGPEQTAPLEAITVVVGANNTGKTNFLRFVEFIKNAHSLTDILSRTWHRPAWQRPNAGESLIVEWECDIDALETTEGGRQRTGVYTLSVERRDRRSTPLISETAIIDGVKTFTNVGPMGAQSQARLVNSSFAWHTGVTIMELRGAQVVGDNPRLRDLEDIVRPVLHAQHVHLRLEALRNDNSVEPTPLVGDGSQLAAVVTRWILEFPDTYAAYNEILSRCLPELKRVLVRSDQSGRVRLQFEQKDGERFDSQQVSDGVMCFAGLVARVLEIPPNSLVLLEEPERGIHPRRLSELIDILRTLVQDRGVQFIIATHSPSLLRLFHDEPEAVLLFRRAEAGTIIRRFSDLPVLVEALQRTDPGELLASGAFNEAFE